ncbi:tellurite resistance TerB family protein [Capilliphycus salinus ALCB114379]|uniref:tellurite resistance TerB family protein n=1 Tax=Capilliphycus salinus TaxID=2768948 RepID=UPI0039A461D0
MNLLEKMFGVQDTDRRISLSPAEAFAAIAVAAISADGYLSNEERHRIVEVLSQVDLFQGYSEQRLTELLEKLFNLLSVRGIDPLVAIARESLPHQLQETAFTVAVDLVLVDGELSPKEKSFIVRLWNIMDIPVETASQILDLKVEEYDAVEIANQS